MDQSIQDETIKAQMFVCNEIQIDGNDINVVLQSVKSKNSPEVDVKMTEANISQVIQKIKEEAMDVDRAPIDNSEIMMPPLLYFEKSPLKNQMDYSLDSKSTIKIESQPVEDLVPVKETIKTETMATSLSDSKDAVILTLPNENIIVKKEEDSSLKIHDTIYPVEDILPTDQNMKTEIMATSLPDSKDAVISSLCDKNVVVKKEMDLSLKINEEHFTCEICQKKFDYKYRLSRHMGTHSDVRPFKCDECSKEFKDKSSLKRHKVYHTGIKPFVCQICSKAFFRKAYLVSHLRTHHTVKKLESEKQNNKMEPTTTSLLSGSSDAIASNLNNKNFIVKKELESLVNTNITIGSEQEVIKEISKNKQLSNEGENFTCQICQKEFDQKYRLTRHMRTHSDVREFKCDECPKEFKDNCGLRKHKMYHTGIRKFVCEICSKAFFCKSYLSSHMEIHSGGRFPCLICSKKFISRGHLKRHAAIHTESKPHQCELCLMKFRDQWHMRKHVLRRHEDKALDNILVTENKKGKKKYSCKLCPKQYTTSGQLSQHKNIHTGKKYTCTICSKQYAQSQYLNEHIKKHTGITENKCEICSKEFCDQLNWKRHKRLGIFECEVCLMKFCGKLRFSQHKLTHRELNSFKCSVCSKGFPNINVLKTHERVHTGDKPFKCKICSKGFTQKISLSYHELIHRGLKPHKCDICPKAYRQVVLLLAHKQLHCEFREFKCEGCSQKLNVEPALPSEEQFQNERTRIKCGICLMDFPRIIQIPMENIPSKKSSEGKGKKSQCPICYREFSFASNMIRHKQIHCGNKDFQCEKCSKKYTSKAMLKLHQYTHSGTKPYKCDHCPATFTCKTNLLGHVNKHLGFKPFKCDICGKEFSQKQSMYNHKQIHHRAKSKCNLDDDKRYTCGKCSKKFASLLSYRAHLLSHDEKHFFKCDKCPKEFKQQRALRNHSFIHKEKKKFQCKICLKGFLCKSLLDAHERSHNGIKPFKCELCSKAYSYKPSLQTHMISSSHIAKVEQLNANSVKLKKENTSANTFMDVPDESPCSMKDLEFNSLPETKIEIKIDEISIDPVKLSEQCSTLEMVSMKSETTDRNLQSNIDSTDDTLGILKSSRN